MLGQEKGMADVQWELLEDLSIWPADRKPSWVSVTRVNLIGEASSHTGIDWEPYLTGELNIAVIASRPRFSQDVPSQLVAQLIHNAAQTSGKRINVHVIRPGTLEAFRSFCETVRPERYQLIHFDLHGTVVDEW